MKMGENAWVAATGDPQGSPLPYSAISFHRRCGCCQASFLHLSSLMLAGFVYGRGDPCGSPVAAGPLSFTLHFPCSCISSMVGCDLDGRPWLPPTQLLSNTTIMRPCSRSIFRERWVRVATRGGGEAWERALRLSRLVWIEGIASQRRQAQGPRIRSTQPLVATRATLSNTNAKPKASP